MKYWTFFLTTFLLLAACSAKADLITRYQWQKLAELRGVSSSNGIDNPSIFVFFDPNCAASARLFSSEVLGQPFEKKDVVWIPVSYMSSSSLGKAVSILRSGNFLAIQKNFMNFNFAHSSGAIKEVVPDKDEVARINYSNEVWRGLGEMSVTPMIVYKNRSGVYSVHRGYKPIHEIDEILKSIPSSKIPVY